MGRCRRSGARAAAWVGAVEVISDNERYGTETISGDQLAQLHIVGRVVWQGRRI